MKHRMKLRILTVVLAAGVVSSALAADPVEWKSPAEKLSYAIGMNMAAGLKRQAVEADVDAMARGIRESLAGKSVLTEQEARDTITAWQKERQAKLEEERKKAGEKNKTEGAAFLEENKKKTGVVALPSGLQYNVVTEGKGDSPKGTDTVTVHYRGTLIDGTEFDSSYKNNQPATFQLDRVIKGWTEGLQLMKPGAKFHFVIPPDLAYKERGSGPQIGPNATLVFDVEMVSFKSTQAATPAPAAEPVTSDIIKVPSAAEIKKGAQVEVIKSSDIEKYKAAEKAKAAKEAPPTPPAPK